VGDPAGPCETGERLSVEPSRGAEVDVLDRRGVAELGELQHGAPQTKALPHRGDTDRIDGSARLGRVDDPLTAVAG
jgi:hypothetical protein